MGMFSRIFQQARNTHDSPNSSTSSTNSIVPNYLYQPEQPLLQLTQSDRFAVHNAFEGVQIFGGTGSGKSSGSGRALAHAFLRSGWGGLVLCAKPEERALWEHYAKETGRSHSILVINGDNGLGFNFLDYELARIDSGATTDNVVSVLLNIIEASKKNKNSNSENPFWLDASREFLSNAIDVLLTAYGQVRLADILKLAQTIQRSEEELQDTEWQEKSFCFQTIRKAHQKPMRTIAKEDLQATADYFRYTFGRLDSKTRSNLVATLSSLISPFLKGKLRTLLCTDTKIVPEMTHEGIIIILDLPIKTWEQAGIVAQHIFKYSWQRATERRAKTQKTRPVFLWADECQLFTSNYDSEFQSTARSSKACTVYITQSIEAYLHAQGGNEHAVYSMLTNFQTKIFHTNTDNRTNQYAADLIGKWKQLRHNQSNSSGSSRSSGESISKSKGWSSGSSGSSGINSQSGYSYSNSENKSHSSSTNEGMSNNQSSGSQEVIDYLLQPSFFTYHLRKGGRENGFIVDGVVINGGQIWSNRTPALICKFPQK